MSERVAAERHAEDAGRDRDEGANDRRTRPSNTAQSPQRSNQRSARSSRSGVEVEPAPVALEQRPAAVVADRPADERADRVPDRAGEGHRRRRPRTVRVDRVAEEDDVLPGERAGRERARVDHHELARGREDGVDEHQDEDGVDAVVADEGSDRGDDQAGATLLLLLSGRFLPWWRRWRQALRSKVASSVTRPRSLDRGRLGDVAARKDGLRPSSCGRPRRRTRHPESPAASGTNGGRRPSWS